jgi:3-hydroxyacyl-CoA dehydrogenase
LLRCPQQEIDGFVLNRLQYALLAEAERLVEVRRVLLCLLLI